MSIASQQAFIPVGLNPSAVGAWNNHIGITSGNPHGVTAAMVGDTTTCASPVTNANINNGTLNLASSVTGTLSIYGGIVAWTAGNIANTVVYPSGSLDGSASATSRTLTAATVYQNGTLNLDCGLRGSISASNITSSHGTIIAPVGAQVSVS